MFRTAPAAPPRPDGPLRFGVHRSALAEAGADAALGAVWLLLWLVFMLALAPPAPASPLPPRRVDAGAVAQPAPGPSAWGVAPAGPGGAG